MKKIFVLAMLVVVTGCTTLKDAQSAKGTGEFRSYPHSYDRVWGAARQVVDSSKLDLIAADKEGGQILAQKGMSAFSYGENVAVFVEPEGVDSTKVEVVSKRALQTNITAKNWSSYILDKISEMLQ